MNKRIKKKIAKRKKQEEKEFVEFLEVLLQKGYNGLIIDNQTQTITLHKKNY